MRHGRISRNVVRIMKVDFKTIASRYEYFGESEGFVGPDSRDLDGDTLLHRAAHLGREQDVIDLLALGCDVNVLGDCDNTPLHYAAMAGHAGTVCILIAVGADARLFNKFGYTPGGFAEFSGHRDVADLIEDESAR